MRCMDVTPSQRDRGAPTSAPATRGADPRLTTACTEIAAQLASCHQCGGTGACISRRLLPQGNVAALSNRRHDGRNADSTTTSPPSGNSSPTVWTSWTRGCTVATAILSFLRAVRRPGQDPQQLADGSARWRRAQGRHGRWGLARQADQPVGDQARLWSAWPGESRT